MRNIDLITTTQARKTRNEAYQNTNAVPVKSVASVASIISDLNQGRVQKFVEFYNYILDRDLDIASVFSSRIDRAISQKWSVVPASNDPNDTQAAEFIRGVLQDMPNLYESLVSIAEAIILGFSAHEIEWKFRNGNIVPTDLQYVNQRRFIYTPQWSLRLYDYGLKGSYGEDLLKDKWVVHYSKERQGDPCMYGVVRAIAYPFLFRHWTNKFWLHYSEVYGQPHILVNVSENTSDGVIEEIRDELLRWSYDHVAVVKGETQPNIVQGSNTQSVDGYERYLKWSTEAITRFVLGSSDINQAGDVGSLAAVESRTESVAEPKRDRDRLAIASTLQEQLFKPTLELNRHLFGGVEVAAPKFVFTDIPAPATEQPAQSRVSFSKKATWA